MIGAPAPLGTSARSTVRKSIEYRVALVVFGIEACSWSPENSMIPPTGGTTREALLVIGERVDRRRVDAGVLPAAERP